MSKGKKKQFNKGNRKYPNKNHGNEKFQDKDKGNEKSNTYILKEAEKGNDFIWYNKNGNLTQVAASYFLSNPAGRPVGYLNEINNATQAIPGIMQILMLPSVSPTSTDADVASVSGLNLAAKQLYAKMRKANAGARSQYEAPDLLIYTLAVGSIYAFIASCARAYGFLGSYPTNNRYYVKPLVEAMGFDYEDLIKNRLQFLNFINTSITRLSRFVIPQGFSLINRMVWINSNTFVDTYTTVKAQIYVPMYTGYWQFDGTSMQTGGCLKIKHLNDTPRTVEEIIAYFEELVAPIAQDDDFLTISGDIMKFTDSYVSMQAIPVDYKLNPIYDEDVMLQIHNEDHLTISNIWSTTHWEVSDLGEFPGDLPFNSTYTLFQKDGLLFFQPILNINKTPDISVQLPAYSKIHQNDGSLLYIDTPEDSPSVERITEATRLITTYDINNQTAASLSVDSCGAEIIVGVKLITDKVKQTVYTYGVIDSSAAGAIQTMIGFAMAAGYMSPFAWDLRLTGYISNEGSTFTHWNTRSVGTFDKLSFKRLNDIITMSLLTM